MDFSEFVKSNNVADMDIETVAGAGYSAGYSLGYRQGQHSRMLDVPDVPDVPVIDCLREWPAAVFKFEFEAGYLAGWELGNYHAHAA